MAKFKIEYEGAKPENFTLIRQFCKGRGVRITKARMSPTFTHQAHLSLSCDTRRGATAVQKFIWDSINHGAFCEIKKVA